MGKKDKKILADIALKPFLGRFRVPGEPEFWVHPEPSLTLIPLTCIHFIMDVEWITDNIQSLNDVKK